MKSKFISSRSVLTCAVLVTSCLIYLATPLEAETVFSTLQQQVTKQATEALVATAMSASGGIGDALAAPLAAKPVGSATSYVATAYSLRGRTATGLAVTKGIIAADPRILPLGSRVRLDAGPYSGEYLVADTGSSVRGRRIDIWTPTVREAMRFGRRTIKLTVLSFGGKRKARTPATKTPATN
ncbi:MAG TPA: 3D domain-containing protein [Blastocatellia bacterium]|nr:3D domain-containing protein [Blastocatellia bacterium]